MKAGPRRLLIVLFSQSSWYSSPSLKGVARSRDVLSPIVWRGAALARARLPRELVSTWIRPDRMKAGGSRLEPSPMQLDEPGVNASEATSECSALGRFREPLVFTRFGSTSDQTKIARVAGHAPKRLPARRRVQIHLPDTSTFRGRGRLRMGHYPTRWTLA